MGHWVHNYSELVKILTFLLAFHVTNLPNTDERMKISENQVIPMYTSSVIPVDQIKS